MIRQKSGLPPGWEAAVDPAGRLYYVDHINGKTQWDHPFAKINEEFAHIDQLDDLSYASSLSDSVSQLSKASSVPSIPQVSMGQPPRSFHRNQSQQRQQSFRPAAQPAAVETPVLSEKKAYFINNSELQDFALDINPFLVSTKKNFDCFRCKTKCVPPSNIRYQCKSCGENYCKSCGGYQYEIPLQGKDYERAANCCVYCLAHLSTGDQNSMLRYLIILREDQSDELLKFKAAKALLQSIEHEEIMPKPIDDKLSLIYPALYEAVERIGGFDSFWTCIIEFLRDGYPPGLRDLICRIISSVLPRTIGKSCLRVFYNFDTLSLLLHCLDNHMVAEAASEAIVVGAERDLPYYASALEDDEAKLHAMLDVIYRSPPEIQVNICNVITEVCKSAHAEAIMIKLLDNGVLPLIAFLLKTDESLSTQECAVPILLELVRRIKTSDKLGAYTTTILDDIILNNTIETLTKITVHKNISAEGVLMENIMEMFCLLSKYPRTHKSLLTSVSVPAPVIYQNFKKEHFTNLKKGLSDYSFNDEEVKRFYISAFSRAADVLTVLAERQQVKAQIVPTIDHILNMSHEIITNTSGSKQEVIVETTSLSRSVLVLGTYAMSQEMQFKALEILGFCIHRSTFAEVLLDSHVYDYWIETLLHVIGEKRKKVKELSDKNPLPDALKDTLKTQQIELHLVLDLLGLTMYHLISNIIGLELYDVIPAEDFQIIYLRIVEDEGVWEAILMELNTTTGVLYAAKLLHIICCYKEINVVSKVQEAFKKYNLVKVLCDYLIRSMTIEIPSSVVEMIFLALSSFLGSPAYFPWETLDLHKKASEQLATNREYDLLCASQRRANLDLGTTKKDFDLELEQLKRKQDLSSVDENFNLSRKLLEFEMDQRKQCALRLNKQLVPSLIEDDHVSNLQACSAVLRFLQVVCRDEDNRVTNKFEIEPACFNYVSFMKKMDPAALIIALDVFGLMVNMTMLIDSGDLELVCNYLQSMNPLVKCRAIDTLVYASMNTACCTHIISIASGSLTKLLKLNAHLKDPTIDSFYVLQSVLLIITQVSVTETICSQVVRGSLFSGILEVLRLSTETPPQQEIDPEYERKTIPVKHFAREMKERAKSFKRGSKNNLSPEVINASFRRPSLDPTAPDGSGKEESTDIKDNALQCIHVFAKHESCRSILLAANVFNFLLERLGKYALDEYEAGENDFAPMILRRGALLPQPSAGCLASLDTAYSLSTKAHHSLQSSMLMFPSACYSLMKLWANGDEKRSYRALVLLMRCGIIPNKNNINNNSNHYTEMSSPNSKASFSRSNSFLMDSTMDLIGSNTQELELPWSLLVFTKQINLLVAMIDVCTETKTSKNMKFITFDEYADTQVKLFACESLHQIFTEVINDTKKFHNTNSHDFAMISDCVLELLATQNIISKLESLRKITPTAEDVLEDMNLISTLDQGEEVAPYRETDLTNSTFAHFRSNSYEERRKGLRNLVKTIRGMQGGKGEKRVFGRLSIPVICKVLDEIVKSSLTMMLKEDINDDQVELMLIMDLMDVLLILNGFIAYDLIDDSCFRDNESMKHPTDDILIEGSFGVSFYKTNAHLLQNNNNSFIQSNYDDSTTFGLEHGYKLIELVLDGFFYLSSFRKSALRILQNNLNLGNNKNNPGNSNTILQLDQADSNNENLFVVDALLECFDTNLSFCVNQDIKKPCLSNTDLQIVNIREFEGKLDIFSTILNILLNFGKFSEGLLVDKVISGNFIYLFTTMVTAANIVTHIQNRPFPRKIQTKVTDLLERNYDATIFEKVFYVLHLISCGKNVSIELFKEDPNFLPTIQYYIGGDIEDILNIINEQKDYQNPEEIIGFYFQEALSCKIAFLANLCNSMNGTMTIYEMSAEMSQLSLLLTEQFFYLDTKLVHVSLGLFRGVSSMVFREDAISLGGRETTIAQEDAQRFSSITLRMAINIAANANDYAIVDQALALTIQLTPYPAARRFLQHRNTLTLATLVLEKLLTLSSAPIKPPIEDSPPAFKPRDGSFSSAGGSSRNVNGSRRDLMSRSGSGKTSTEVVFSPENMLQSKALTKCVQLVYQVVLSGIDLSHVFVNFPSLLKSLTDLLLSLNDSSENRKNPKIFNVLQSELSPLLIQVGQIVQILIQFPGNREIFKEELQGVRILPPDGPLHSYLLGDIVHRINALLFPGTFSTPVRLTFLSAPLAKKDKKEKSPKNASAPVIRKY